MRKFSPDDERIVMIEDTAEIQIQKPNVLRFEAPREQNGVPAVTIRDLLKATLRRRHDRIILGEIGGGEAFDLLQLPNTRTQRHAIHRSCQLRRARHFALYDMRFAERRGNAVSRLQVHIAEWLNIVVQIQRRPGLRFVSEVLQIQGYSPEADRYSLRPKDLGERNPFAE